MTESAAANGATNRATNRATDGADTRTPLERLRRSGPGRAATAAAKQGLRVAGVASASWRPGPELLVIGAKRGGTTSLWRYLHEHPGILPTFPSAQQIKGTYFFDEEWERGPRWYRSHFATTATRAVAARRLGYRPVTFEASPYYLFHPLAPQRARLVVPDALVVAVLRDPVERAFSHWKERSNHTETLSFTDALDAEEARTRGQEELIVSGQVSRSFAHRHQTYVAQGCYAPMLERWTQAFGPDRVVVAASEELYADPQAFCDDLTDRLGLPRHPLSSIEPWNAEPSAAMDPAVRARLTEQLTPHIQATEAFLGRSLPWPRLA